MYTHGIEAKFNLDPEVTLVYNKGLTSREVRLAKELIEENEEKDKILYFNFNILQYICQVQKHKMKTEIYIFSRKFRQFACFFCPFGRNNICYNCRQNGKRDCR